MFIPWFRAEAWNIPLPVDLPLIGDTIPIQPFGVLVATGVLTAARVAEWFARKRGFEPAVAADLVTHIVVVSFICAYVLNGIFYHPDTLSEILASPRLFFSRWLGLSSYGGFVGTILGIYIWKVRRKLPVMPIADAAAFCFPFGWFFGRMGCFVVHDHPGRETDFFLAVADYQVGSPPWVPRHDLGLYEVFWSAAVVALFLVLFRKKRKAGVYVALLPLLYAPIRFFLDYLRADPSEGGDLRYGNLTPGQYASIGFTLLSLALLRYVLTKEDMPLPKEIRI